MVRESPRCETRRRCKKRNESEARRRQPFPRKSEARDNDARRGAAFPRTSEPTMPFDDAAEAKCADSESEDEYVESRLERVLREEAGEAKPEAPRYTQLDDELLSDMQRGDEQMRRLVRHRLNKQREAADEKVCRQLLRKERFELACARAASTTTRSSRRSRSARRSRRCAPRRSSARTTRGRRGGSRVCGTRPTRSTSRSGSGTRRRARRRRPTEGRASAKEMAQRLARAAFVDRKRREAGLADAS